MNPQAIHMFYFFYFSEVGTEIKKKFGEDIV